LLREAVFTDFRSPYWTSARKAFQTVPPQGDQQSWRLAASSGRRQSVFVTRYTRQNEVALALPAGVYEVRDLPALAVETNRLTAARAQGVLPLVTYAAHYSQGNGFDAPPDEADDHRALAGLREADREAIERLAAELGIKTMAPREALRTVARHFETHFAYALYQPASTPPQHAQTSALSRFLFETRRGHCEFFATATTLLLRAAGVPARYVVGYSVQEPQGDGFVVRARHAHAWSLAFLEGRWEEVDNTPASWAGAENAGAPFWEPIYDRVSNLWLAYNQWRLGESQWRAYVFGAGMLVLSFMAWRELRGGRWRRAQGLARSTAHRDRPGHDSEFYALEAALARRFVPRPAGEPLAAWLHRLSAPSGLDPALLRRLLDLHYRLRFHPVGLTGSEREELKRGVAGSL
jgi:transglutaminase-like putative cysteine protease